MTRTVFDWRLSADEWREDDLLRRPEDGQRYELVDSSLHVTPPAGFGHHELADEIRLALRAAAPPGWRVIREIGLRVPAGNLIPDLTVLRPDAPADDLWADPAQVALVVEVESPGSRRHDRFTKPALYAEAGIESYWRIERIDLGPAAHLYQRAKIGHYELVGSVGPADRFRVELPFAVTVTPADWTA
ncbi:Uma2 family endonuclease [Micromonospora sp. CPCC 206060]|uniref:Uma2 family endonuclease n=1 Tax=Micromonospora sp. CPCC 206060 TaxID=3122406 RepID=UPI002FEED2FF